METLRARRAWIDVLQTLRDHRCQSRMLYRAIDEEGKAFHDKSIFKQYISTNPAQRRH